MSDDGKVKQIRPILEEFRQDMLDKLDEIRAGVIDGSITSVVGVIVYEDDDGDEFVRTFEEGVAADDAEIVLALRDLESDYEEQWRATRLGRDDV